MIQYYFGNLQKVETKIKRNVSEKQTGGDFFCLIFSYIYIIKVGGLTRSGMNLG